MVKMEMVVMAMKLFVVGGMSIAGSHDRQKNVLLLVLKSF